MTLVEKMAEAMYRAPPAPGIPWEDLSETARTVYLNEARAALAVVMEEMREPSEGMVEAAWTGTVWAAPRRAWRAMLDQFEKEHTGG